MGISVALLFCQYWVLSWLEQLFVKRYKVQTSLLRSRTQIITADETIKKKIRTVIVGRSDLVPFIKLVGSFPFQFSHPLYRGPQGVKRPSKLLVSYC